VRIDDKGVSRKHAVLAVGADKQARAAAAHGNAARTPAPRGARTGRRA
jgi:hypothetical protein